MLSRFNIIVATDDNNGIGKNNTIPWINTEAFNYFNSKTIGKGNNVVVMGRKTYESLPDLLPKRKNIVITSQMIEGVTTYTSLFDALQSCCDKDKVYIIGGQHLYQEALSKYSYLCNKILISRISGTYDCDTFFPRNLIKSTDLLTQYCQTYKLEIIHLDETHPEREYLDLLEHIRYCGQIDLDGTKSMFGQQMEFDLRDGFPLITTREMNFEKIKQEMTSIIPHHLNDIISSLQTNMINKTHFMISYAHHCCMQFYIGSEREKSMYLDCCIYQLMEDVFSDVPQNIALYALILHAIANIVKLIPRKLIYNIGHGYISLNHIGRIDKQIERQPYPFPTVNVLHESDDDSGFGEIMLENYRFHSEIDDVNI